MEPQQTIEPGRKEAFTQKKAALRDDIDALQAKLVELKAARRVTDWHIAVKDIPQDLQFSQLSTHSKHFVDAIKMVALPGRQRWRDFLSESLTR